MRIVCQFSCGAASAVATKLTIAEHPDCIIVNAFIKEEHEDNRRFLADCEKWFGKKCIVVWSDKYGASTKEVWMRKQYIKGPNGAPCSLELKRKMLAQLSEPGDINVIGFTAEEEDRFDDLCERFPNERFVAPLIEKLLTKEDCLAIVDRAGIALPAMYLLGYDNANCIGCPKGGQRYWQKIRADFPDRFAKIQALQESIGPGAYFLQFRSGVRSGERMSLTELPQIIEQNEQDLKFNCSFFCEIAEHDLEAKP